MIQIVTLFLSSVAVYSLKPLKYGYLIKQHAETTSELKSILLITLCMATKYIPLDTTSLMD
jgi:hypothetical protein